MVPVAVELVRHFMHCFASFPPFLCCFLSSAASDSPEEAGKPKRKLNFRRLLLNKCQEEFEKGDAAMNAVAEREKKEKEGGDDDKVRGGGTGPAQDKLRVGSLPA